MTNQNKILLKQTLFKKLKQLFTYSIFNFKINYSRINPKNYNWKKVKNFLKMFIIVMTAVFMVLLTIDIIKTDFFSNDEEDEKFVSDISDRIIAHLDENYFTAEDTIDTINNCNVTGIILHGELTTYISPDSLDENSNLLYDQSASKDIVYYINEAEKDDSIKAIILEIDSYGGSAVAAEEISNALENAKKPTVAFIRNGGVSAGYWSATGADKIFASKNSDVGSIGVTMSYIDYAGQNQKEGLTYNQLSSGKFKDMGDPDKALSAEETKLLMRDVNIIYQNFIKAVAENRNLDIKKVESLADGSSILGQMALENGLIDQIGEMPEVKEYLKEKIGEEVEVCW
ncbi:signal peptide peptidase SppA [Candidatus Falkowbacteria bacterium CG_4_10_14_0_2_um_filter_36_22]|nr:MAG: signal peptide peptidase SppA [Candidatus Falkowbacteria bacterium CG_4_10_14_0_2_um_filter_36_22]